MNPRDAEENTFHVLTTDGKPIIRKGKTYSKLDEINPYQMQLDYRAINKALNVGICEILGKRDRQQDNVAAAFIPEFMGINEEAREAVLMKTVAMLHDIVVKVRIGIDDGTTLCAAVISGNNIYNINLGDSSLFSCKKSANDLAVTQVNEITFLHFPLNTYDVGLNVKESLGDSAFDGFGISHNPTFKKHVISLEPNQKAMAIVACDGLTEQVIKKLQRELRQTALEKSSENDNAKVNPIYTDINSIATTQESFEPSAKEIAAWEVISDSDSESELEPDSSLNINEYKSPELQQLAEDWVKKQLQVIFDKDPDEIAVSLTQAAFDQGSKDNISVVATTIDPNEDAKYIAVFDGHGHNWTGHLVARACSELFDAVLNNQIHVAKLKLISENMANRIEQRIQLLLSKFIPNKENYEIRTESELYILKIKQGIDECNKVVKQLTDEFEILNSVKLPPALDLTSTGVAKQAYLLALTDELVERNSAFVAESTTAKNLKSIYQIANIIFNIRVKYNNKMPSSFDEKFNEFEDDNRGVIKDLEQGVKAVFDLYPDKPIEEAVAHLKQIIDSKVMAGATPAFFAINSELRVVLEKASAEISEISDKMQIGLSKRHEF